MTVDKGFVSAFGGTFGVVAAIVVISTIIPMVMMAGCTGCVLVMGAMAPRDEQRKLDEPSENSLEEPLNETVEPWNQRFGD